MEKLFKCEVCGLILLESELQDVCPKCGVPRERFKECPQEMQDKIFRSDKTNDMLAKLITLSEKMIKTAEKGIEDNLDPGCVKTFEVAKKQAWLIKQMTRAEIAIHVGKEKW